MKKLFVLVGIFVALLIAVAVMAPLVIGLAPYRRLIETRGEEFLGRKITIGEMHLSLWRGAGVELRQVRIANARGFADASALSLDRIRVSLKLRPLLSRNVQISSILIDRPSLLVERRADGTTNFDDVVSRLGAQSPGAAAQSSSPVPSAEAGGAVVATLFIGNVRLRGASVILREARGRPGQAARPVEHRVTNIDFSASDFAFGRPLSFRLAARLGPAANSNEQNVRLTGRLGELSPHLSLDGLTAEGAFEITELSTAWLRELSSGGLPITAGTLAGRGDWRLAQKGILTLHGSLTGSALKAGPQAQTALPANLDLEYQLRLDTAQQRLTITEAALTADGQRLRIKGSISELFASNPEFNLDLQSEAIDLERLLASLRPPGNSLGAEITAQGPVELTAEAQGNLDRWAASARVGLRAARITIGSVLKKPSGREARIDLAARGAGASVELKELTLRLPPVSVRVAGSFAGERMQLSGRATVAPNALEHLAALSPELEAAVPAGVAIEGPLDLRFAVYGTFNAPSLAVDVDLARNALRFSNFLRKPAGVAAGITARLSIKQQTLEIEQLRAALGDLVMTGTLSVPTGGAAPLAVSIASNPVNVQRLSSLFPILGGKGQPLNGTVQMKLAAHGQPESPRFRYDAEAKFNRLGPLEAIVSLARRLDVALPEAVQLGGDVSGSAAVLGASAGLKVRTDLDLRSSRLRIGTYFTKPHGTPGSAQLNATWRDSNLVIERLAFDIAPLKVEGKGTVKNLADPGLDFAIAAALRSGPPIGGTDLALTGRGKVQAVVRGPLSNLRRLRVTGNLNLPKLRAANVSLSDARGSFELREGIMRLRPLTFRAFGGRQQGEVSLDVLSAERTVQIRTKIENVRLESLLLAFSPAAAAVSGALTATFQGQAQAVDAERLKQTLHGAGRLSLRNGTIKNFNILDQISEVTNLVNLGPPSRRSPHTPFTEISTPVEIGNGIVTTPRVVFHSGDLDATARGSFNFDLIGRYEVDATLSAEISRRLRNKLTDALRNQQGRIAFPVVLSGDLTHPKIRPGKRLAELLATNLVGSLFGGNRIGDLLPSGDPISSLIGSLFGGVKKRRQGSTSVSGSPSRESVKTPAVAAPPSLRIGAQPDRLRRGDPFQLSISMTPGGRTSPVDGYVVIRLPNEQLTYIDAQGRLSRQAVPFRKQFVPAAFSGPIFRHTIAREPAGTYTVLAILVEPGRNPFERANWVSPLAEASFVVE